MHNKTHPQRKSPRLPGYDYAQPGVYFITICTAHRQHLFGNIENGMMICNTLGQIAHQELFNLPSRWHMVDVDTFVVMPNHIHAIILITGTPLAADVSTADAQKRVPTGNQGADAQKHVPTGNQGADAQKRVPTGNQGADAQKRVPTGNQGADAQKRVPTGNQGADAQKRVPTLGQIVGNYKGGVTRLARREVAINTPHIIWQQRYHDHIIRNEEMLNYIRDYVVNNPARWEDDTFYG
jgi:REP element-mobilizing transposase RayT